MTIFGGLKPQQEVLPANVQHLWKHIFAPGRSYRIALGSYQKLNVATTELLCSS